MSSGAAFVRVASTFALAATLPVAQATLRAQAVAVVEPVESKVNAVFSRWDSTSTPGCAVGVSVNGRTVLARGYGMADLEHDEVIEPDTIFEAGSVSKQFTAAAVLLLAREGKLSLDDPARKHVPELPDYGTPITIRQMLQHTSGLRDWGTMEEIAGWPRTSRVYTHAHVLDIVGRQRAVNFTPGTDWSYCNTGYNLAAVIVSRVSGEPFAEFTRKRIFEPLGMTRTSWRDDHTRIVKDRAMAYRAGRDGFETLMPFENVHGNGGLLTTVEDLLKWNENFVSPKVGDQPFVSEQQQSGRLASGREHHYGLGLFLGERNGLPEVYHSGGTAGYRAFLTRFPARHTSVAVLCNVSTAAAERYAHEVADLYLAKSMTPPPSTTPRVSTEQELDAKVGLYRSVKRGTVVSIVREKGGLRVEGGGELRPATATRFTWGGEAIAEFDQTMGGARPRSLRVSFPNGTDDTYERVELATPSPEQLAQLAGTYRNDEIETSLTLTTENGVLRLTRRPGVTMALKPLYADAFDGEIGTVRVVRDARGRVTQLSVVNDRAWDVRFDRVSDQRR